MLNKTIKIQCYIGVVSNFRTANLWKMTTPSRDRPLVLPNPSSGKGSWESLISHFEDVAAENSWNDDQKLLWLRVRLTDRACTAYTSLPQLIQASPQPLKRTTRTPRNHSQSGSNQAAKGSCISRNGTQEDRVKPKVGQNSKRTWSSWHTKHTQNCQTKRRNRWP